MKLKISNLPTMFTGDITPQKMAKSKKMIAWLTTGLLVSVASSQAADILKLSTGALSDPAGWSGGVLPGSGNVGLFDGSSVPSGAGATFDASGSASALTFGGLKFTTILGNITFNNVATVTIGASGLDMSTAGFDVGITGGTLRFSAASTLNVGSGRTLTIYNTGTSANINTETFTGGGTLAIIGTYGGGNRLALNVTGNSTIAGTGTYKPNNNSSGYGITINAGSSISPGTNGIGTLTLNSAGDGRPLLSMVDGSLFRFDLGSGTVGSFATPASSDRLVLTNIIAGDLVFGGTSTIDLKGTGFQGVFKLFDTDSNAWSGLTLSGQQITGGLVISNLASGMTGVLYMGDGGSYGDLGDIYLQVTDPSYQPVTSLTWAVGNGTWDIDITSNWNNGAESAAYHQAGVSPGDFVTFNDTATVSSPTITLNTNVNPSGVTNNSTKNFTITGTGSIGGSCSLIKTGSSTLTLGTTNTFSGGINLNGGTTVFSTISNLGAGAVNLGGGTLQFAIGNTDDISVRTVSFNAGGATIDDNGQTISFASAIGNAGAGSFTKTGSGTMTLHGANGYYGNTTVSQGTLALASGASLPHSTNIVVSSGATYDVSGVGVYHLVSGIAQTLSGTGTVHINGTLYVDAGTSLSPGTTNTVGTLTCDTYTSLQISGNLLMNVTTSGSDLIIANDVTINSGADLYIYSSGLTNGNYELLRTDSGYTDNGFTLHFSQSGKSGSLVWIGGSLYLAVADNASDDLTWSGSSYLWDQGISTDWYLTGGVTSWAFTNGDVVRFDETGAANSSVTLSGVLQPSLMVVSNPVTDYYLNDGGSAKISGTANLMKQGAGNLTISTLNDNTGYTTIQGGTLTVAGTISTGPVTNNSALVMNASVAQTFASIGGTGGLTLNQTASGTTINGAANYTGPTTINVGTLTVGSGGVDGVMSTSAITNNGTLILNSSTDWTYSMPNTGTGNLRKQGTNTLTINNVSTRTGETRADDGRIILANANQLHGNVRLEGGAVLDLHGNDQAIGSLISGSYGAKVVNDSGAATNLLSITDNAGSTVQARVVDNEGTGGAIRVLKLGTGETYWRGTNNTYSGGTEIREGRIRMNSSDLWGSGPVDMTGGGIYLAGTCATNVLNLLTPVTSGNTNYLICGGNITFTTPLAGTNDLLVNFIDGSSGALTFRLSGGASQFANVTNTVYLNGGPTYGGYFSFYNDEDLSAITINMDSSNVRIASSAQRTMSLGAVTGNNNTASLSAPSGSTYVIGAKNLSTTFAGYLGTANPTNRVANNLVKVGIGTLTLTGTNAFSGSLIVSNGTLAVSQDVAAPSMMSLIRVVSGATLDLTGLTGNQLNLGVNTNQTLTGSGVVQGNVNVASAGTINPGYGIGTLTITGNTTLGGNLLMELNRTNGVATNDLLVVNGTLTIGGVLTVTNLGPALQGGDTFKLFTGAVSGFTVTNLPALTGIKYWTNNLAINGTITVIDPINTNPPVMGAIYSGGVLSLSWPTNSGWTLQQQTNSLTKGLGTNWVDVPGSTSITSTNITVDPAKPTVFYRLKL